MAAINFTTMKTRVKLRLGNMQTSDPFETYVDEWVNDAANRVILRALTLNAKSKQNLFPELESKWRTDATTAGTEYIAYPADCLWIDSVFSFDSSTATDENRDPRYVMTEIADQRTWELLDKTTSTVGQPRRWRRFSNRIQVHPVPDSNNLTKLLIIGFAEESDLSGDTDVFTIDYKWHPAIVDMAVYLGAVEMEWTETAATALMAVDRRLQESISIRGRENASDYMPLSRVMNDPTR